MREENKNGPADFGETRDENGMQERALPI